MPYIKQDRRNEIASGGDPENAGELNFAITNLITNYMDEEPLNYSLVNEIVGVLECAKAEFIRRVVVPYEGTKIRDNGDVYV